MNIFQKIREVKLPFLAVVASLAFGGIIAPASAAVPVLSAVTASSLSESGATLTMTVDQSVMCKFVVRLDTTAAPANWGEVDVAVVGSTNVFVNTGMPFSTTPSASITGLSASTTYKAYAFCTNSSIERSSVVASAAFTTTAAAAPTVTTGSATVSAGSATVNYTMSRPTAQGGVGCKAIGRLASAAAPSVADLLAKTTFDTNSGDLGAFASNVSNPNALSTDSITFNSLSAATNFVAYIACQGFGLQSQMFTVAFTTSTATTITGTADVGETLTSSGGPTTMWFWCPSARTAAAYASGTCGRIRLTENGSNYSGATFTVPATFYSYALTVTQRSAAGAYILAAVTGSASATVQIAGGSAPSSSTPTTTAVQRPLPQINFAANPVNGVSARPTADTRKGTLTIEGSNLSDLTSITIGGKAATFTVKDGKLDIKLPAGVTGFPEVVMTNASGSITMQNAIEIYAPTVQKLTKFVGERLTLAGMEVLENLYINNKTATALEATVVVAPDATEAEIAKAVAAATKAVTYIDKVGKRIVRTAVTVSKTGEAGTKPAIEMSFTK